MRYFKSILISLCFTLVGYSYSFAIALDTDGDYMSNEWEIANGLNPNSASDANLDPDADGLLNYEEYFTGHNPNVSDPALTDAQLLELTEHKAFLFFWEKAVIPTGGTLLVPTPTKPIFVPDNGDFDGAQIRLPSEDWYSIASIGFALSAIVVADHRGWVDHVEAYNRVYQTLKYFRNIQIEDDWHRVKHGFFYHFYDNTGTRTATSEISSIDHALFIAGAMAAGQYYHGTPAEDLANQLYAGTPTSTQWNWMYNKPLPGTGFINMAWHLAGTPNGNCPVEEQEEGGCWNSDSWDRYSELMILLDLATSDGAGIFKVPETAWLNINRQIVSNDVFANDIPDHINAGSLHNHQYSHMYLDLKDRPDSITTAYPESYNDYFKNSMWATLSNRAFCVNANASDPIKYNTYSTNVWGLSACNASTGYKVLQPLYEGDGGNVEDNNDSGTVAPFASLGSMPFTPSESQSALRNFYEHRDDNTFLTGQTIWGRYGFLNCFNSGDPYPDPDPLNPNTYFSTNIIGIDLGPIVGMIENYRSGLLWKYSHRSWIIKSGLANMTFDSGSVEPTTISFNSGSDPNEFGSGSGGFGPSGSRSFVADTPDTSAFSMQITGSVATEDGVWIGLNGKPIHQWDTLSFWIKGASGTEAVEVGLKDTSNVEEKVSIATYHPDGAITTTWTKVNIPLEVFINEGVRLTGMDNISFTFTSEGGTILVDQIQFTEDANPPSTPLGFNAEYSGVNQVTLTWNENPERDVVGYRIYKKTGSGSFTEIQFQSEPRYVFVQNSYIDTDITASQTYTYRITAVDNYQNPADAPLYRGLESSPTLEKIVSTNDADSDGLNDAQELALGTDPNDSDTDNDGLTDGAEVNTYLTNPLVADTDGDGLTDGEEVNTYGTDPLVAVLDPDSDGLNNTQEKALGTNPIISDTDGDGLTDGDEVNTYNTDPLDSDTDNDGLNDGAEVNTYTTDPLDDDTDDDTYSDYQEVTIGTNPNDAAIHSAEIKITADNIYTLYVNGVLVGTNSVWNTVETYTVNLQPGGVVAIQGDDANGIAALACQIRYGNQYQFSNFTWQYATSVTTNWQTAGYDHSNWPFVTEHYKMGSGPWGTTVSSFFNPNVYWIWSNDATNHNRVYFFRKFDPSENGVVKFAADNAGQLYVDGDITISTTSWSAVKMASVALNDGSVIAAHCHDNIDSGGVPGVGSCIFEATREVNGIRQTVVSDSSAKGTTTLEAGWETPGFTDSGWPAAIVTGALGVSPWFKSGTLGLINSAAKWIWAGNKYSNNDVWLRKTVSQIPAAILVMTCDNAFTVYHKGLLAGSGNVWNQPKTINLYNVNYNDIIAVKGLDNPGATGIASLIGTLTFNNQTFNTNSNWKVSTVEETNWNTQGFNDAAWASANQVGTNGMLPWRAIPGVSSLSKWIWSSNITNDNTAYFRYRIPNAVMTITCDNKFDAYHNGQPVGSSTVWNQPKTIDLYDVQSGDVIAIKGMDNPGVGVAALIASISYNSQTLVTNNTNWKRSLGPFINLSWTQKAPTFDDSGWVNATLYPSGTSLNGIAPWGVIPGVATTAKWIWSNDVNNHNTVYFRYIIP